MFWFIGLLGFLGLIIFPMMAIVSIFKKNGKAKRYFMIAGISFIVFLVGAVNDGSGEIKSVQEEKIEHESVQAAKEKEKEKAEEEAAQKKAEQEAKEEAEAQKKAEQEAKEKAEKEAEEKKTKEEVAKQVKLSGLKVHFIDVGQADAILLEYAEGDKDYHILIDSGNWNSSAAVNYLKQMNVKQIDLLVGTHPHSDHIGQMDTIINQLDVSEVWMSGDMATTQVFERVINAIEAHDVGYDEPRMGDEYAVGPLDIKVFAPTQINGDLNDGSIAFKASYGNVSFLFTGDAETASERTMLNSGVDLKADILKLGHHGSDTSSTPAFVEAVDPEVGVISVGKKNSYGHPSASVVERMNSRGVDLYSTSDHGTVIIETDGDTYDITTKADGNVTPASSGESSKQASKQKPKNKSVEVAQATESSNGNCIDINSANQTEVQDIIHIGPERSADLIELRPYKSVEDLSKIKGIGPARIDDIKAQNSACVGG